MLTQLSPLECRVIGVMLEKETTTPDQYPLSLNGLTTGCNQKSNREPVMDLSESEVQQTLDALRTKKLVTEQTGFGSRVVKYTHRFCNTEFGDLKLTDQQKAIICVMLLRGPQTPGELRTRTQRLADFSSVDEVEAVLEGMMNYQPDPLVMRLARQAGKRESRYAHLFADQPEAAESVVDSTASHSKASVLPMEARVTELEMEVAELRKQLTVIQTHLKLGAP